MVRVLRRGSTRLLAGIVTSAIVGMAACTSPAPPSPSIGTVEPVDGLDAARRRAVTIETTGCGAANDGSGSGIALADDRVLTAAHVVASASHVSVLVGDERLPARVVAFDPLRDLAIIRPEQALTDVPVPPDPVTLTQGQEATVVGGATSGDVSATVEAVSVLEADEVRGDRRSTRRGYRVAARTDRGDSGAGLYDRDGRLAGLVFAVSRDDPTRTWVTAESEIARFLVDTEVRGDHRCDPEVSRLVAS